MTWRRRYSWLHPLTSILLSVVLVLELYPPGGATVNASGYEVARAGAETYGGKIELPPSPAPSHRPSAAVVGPDTEAEITSASGNITLRIPPGAVSRPTRVELAERVPWGSTGRKIVKLFELNAWDNATGENVTRFSTNLTITIRHNADELRGLDTRTLRLHTLVDRRWLTVPGSRYDPQQGVLTATTDHFSTYGEQADPLQNGPGRVMAAQTDLHSGAAVFSYPLELPPGPGGFQPRLTLTYNSGVADEMKNKRSMGSWVGIGWTLHPGSVTRDMSTGRYFLDLNGVSCEMYSTDGTNYRTNPEQYFKITIPETPGNSWEVLDREGNLYRFGGTSDSAHWLQQIGQATQYYRWDLSLIRDTNGNEAMVSYTQEMRSDQSWGNWVRSAYPEYLRYGNAEMRFFPGWDENDQYDGYLRRDNPKRMDDTETPRIMETRRLDAIEVKAGGTLVRKYSFGYTTTERVYSAEYGGYYSGKHTLTSITQVGTDNTSLPSMSFNYQDRLTYRHGQYPENDYYGNPGNPASITWPRLTRVNSGYGGSIAFGYTQFYDDTTWNKWTRQAVTSRVVYSDNVSNVVTDNITYTYTTGDGVYPKYLGQGWDQRYRGFREIKETDAAGNYVKHWFYATGMADGKDAEKLSGREYKTQWYSSGDVLLREKVYDWAAYSTSQVPDFRVRWSYDGWGNGLFGSPYGIAASSDGDIFVTDDDGVPSQTRHRFQKFDLHGDFIFRSGTYGTGNAQFVQPREVAVSGGYIYVADRGNSRVQKFNSSGTYVLQWGSWGTNDGQFKNPAGIGVSGSGYVYVADYDNNRIQKFNTSGTFVTKWTIASPVGVGVSSDGYVYVTSGNYVYKYDANGTYLLAFGGTTGSGQLMVPRGVTVSSDGYVYVADNWAKLIKKYSSGGSYISQWSQANGFLFTSLDDVAVASGSIYVTEEGGHRVSEIMPNWAVRLGQVDETTGGKTSRTRYVYDDYGNVITEYHDGDTSSDSDNATIHRVFYPNTTAHILSSPARERVYATTTDDVGGANLKKETVYYYDGNNSSWVTPPDKGNLTRLERRTDNATTVSSYFTYDSFGNMLTQQDPRGNTTTWTYASDNVSPKSKTYPVSGLSENYTSDPGTRNLTSLLAVNGENTTYEYDSFKRLTNVIKPGDSPSAPGVTYQYNNWGTLNQQHVRVVTRTSGSDNLTRSDFFDGLGRVVQVHSSGETGHTIVASTTAYNNRSLVEKQYVPQDIASQLTSYQAPDAGWKYAAFTFDTTGVSSNLTAFPVLVHLTTGNFDFSLAKSQGADIRFVDSDNSTALSYEIERWVDNTEAWVWVRVPQLDGASTTDHIYLYYGNPSASSAENVTGTWNSDFVFVGHMNDDPDTSHIKDSTGSNNGTKKAAGEPAETTGRIGKAQGYDGSDDYVSIGTTTLTAGATTVSIWQNKAGTGTNPMMGLKIANTGSIFYYGASDATQCAMFGFRQEHEVYSPQGSLAAGSWKHISFVYDGQDPDSVSSYKVYIDGVSQSVTLRPWGIGGSTSTNYIGKEEGGAFDGLIDEVRISSGAHSADWIKASYLSESGSLVTFGGREEYSKRNFGKRVRMTDAVGATGYSYDSRGRLTEERRTLSLVDYTTRFGYDGADRTTYVVYPTSENVSYGYNGRGLPYSVTSNVSGSLVGGTLYNSLGLPTNIGLGNSANITHGYWGIDTAGGYYGRLWEIKTVKPGLTLQHLRHTWDAGGNLVERFDVNTSDNETFGYDFLDRLTSVSGNYTHSYAYNEIGNITSMNGNSYTYGSRPHAVTQVGSTSYAYDDNGNMTTRGSQSIYWDVENRPKAIMPGLSIYYYDGDGKRVKKTSGGQRIYVNRYYEKNLTTGEVTTYYYPASGTGQALGDRTVAMRSDSGLRYIYQDHLTGTAVTDNGTVETIRYYPYGDTRSGSVPTDKKFTGQRLDATGLYYYGARYYDPQIGRFISADTVVPDFKNPQALNRYSYVIDNPLKYTDKTGHFWDWAIDIIGVGWDVVELVTDPSWGNAALLAADIVLWVVPFAPAGAGATYRTVKVVSTVGERLSNTKFLKYTYNNMRENLIRLTGVDPGKSFQAHHVFPEHFKKQFERILKKSGTDMNDPRFGTWVDAQKHAEKSADYNKRWESFFDAHKKAGTEPTAEEILEFGRKQTKEVFNADVNFVIE